MTQGQYRIRAALVALGLFGVAAAAYSETEDALLRRYPFDPACPWGRIANGKGMIVRCVSEQEALSLARATPAEAVPGSAAPAPTSAPSAAPDPSASAPTTPPGNAEAPKEGAPAEEPVSDDFEVTVGPIVADKGELSLGKLAAPKDRYKKCVLDHGGLKGQNGEVQVRFMVRTQGIAEGVAVHRRMNVSSEAARCVADIVDRRRVSVPAEPLVGATVYVKFRRGGE